MVSAALEASTPALAVEAERLLWVRMNGPEREGAGMRSMRRKQPLRIPMPCVVSSCCAVCSNRFVLLSERRMKIGSIVIHCYDFDRTVAFWQAALHYVAREPAKDSWVVFRDQEDGGANLSFQGRDRRPRSRSWLHLDLYTADQQAEVERLVALGARRYPWRYRAGDDFIVLEDPGGALFCVVQKADVPRN